MKTAWILPGGASMGAVQVGQSEALLEAGVMPDLIIGSSAGSLNAAWLAADPTVHGAAVLGELWLAARRSQIFPLRPKAAALGLLGRRDHVVPADGLTRWLEAHLPYRHLEEARIPLTVTTTDLDTGEAVYLSSGPAIPALVASCAIPGVFPPVPLGGRLLVDGGLSISTPVEVAVAAGAQRIYVLPTADLASTDRPRHARDVALRAMNLLLGHVRVAAVTPWVDRVEIWTVPAPHVEGVSPFSFKHTSRLISEACNLTRLWLGNARPLERVQPGEGSKEAGTVRAVISD